MISVPENEICLVIDGHVFEDDITIKKAGINRNSAIDVFRKPHEILVNVKFRGNSHQFIASDGCTVQQIINGILVRLLISLLINRKMKNS